MSTTSHPLPSGGGSYIREADGTLKPAPKPGTKSGAKKPAKKGSASPAVPKKEGS